MVRQTTGSAARLPVLVVSLLGAVACEEPMALTPGYGSGGTESSGGAFVFSGTSSISPVAGDGALPQGCNEHLVSSPEGSAAAVDEEICSAEMEPVLAKGAALIHLEVTSNDRRGAAHAFYRHMGYERTSIRFMKKL